MRARRRGGFELTPEGTLLAELCAPIMRAVREIPSIASTSSGDIHGELTLGVISNFTDRSFDRAIRIFHERFPEVELLISTLSWSSLSGSLMRSETDHLEEAKRLAMLGAGLVLLPETYAAADQTAGRVWPLLASSMAAAIDVFLIDNPKLAQRARRSKRRQGFLDCFK